MRGGEGTERRTRKHDTTRGVLRQLLPVGTYKLWKWDALIFTCLIPLRTRALVNDFGLGLTILLFHY